MNGFTSAEATIIQTLIDMKHQMDEVTLLLANLPDLTELKEDFADLRESVDAITAQKDYYSTRELAEMMGVTQHTVQVRWCAEGRIECEKDLTTGRWRIPGPEFDRLRRGGKPDAA